MISIKGIRQGLLIVFDEGFAWEEQISHLQTKLSASANFFKGGNVAFDVRNRPLTIAQLEQARSLLTEYEVTLWAVQSQSDLTRARAAGLGLKTEIVPTSTPDDPAATDASVSTQSGYFEGTDGVLIRRRVRSGQLVRHPGHIVVLADVNPGAQLIAGGDIIVWGKLQGTAHAGALGDAEATICALELSPSILRIAEVARRFQAGKRGKHARPEQAHIKQEEMVVTEWNP